MKANCIGDLLSSLLAQMVKNLPATWETQVQSVGQEDLLEKEMATHSSIPAWRILAGYSPWGCKGLNMTERLTPCSVEDVKAITALILALQKLVVHLEDKVWTR